MADEIKNAALLVMDVQQATVNRLSEKEKYIDGVRQAVGFAHKNRIPVIYVVVGFRKGLPEVSENNKGFAAIKATTPDALLDPVPFIDPVGDDVVVVKRRVSAFSGSDLEVILRAKNIRQLVLAGIATSGVVLSTTREAADKDYGITILSDLCMDFDPEVHKVLMDKVFPRQAAVMSLKEWTV
jgi:nicotinamidase-related amidase